MTPVSLDKTTESYEFADWFTILVVHLLERTETDGSYYRIGLDYHGCFELILESLEKNLIAADLE